MQADISSHELQHEIKPSMIMQESKPLATYTHTRACSCEDDHEQANKRPRIIDLQDHNHRRSVIEYFLPSMFFPA
jgi:hypothetical protein